MKNLSSVYHFDFSVMRVFSLSVFYVGVLCLKISNLIKSYLTAPFLIVGGVIMECRAISGTLVGKGVYTRGVVRFCCIVQYTQ